MESPKDATELAQSPLDLKSLQLALQGGSSFQYRLFYGHTPRKDGQLSDAVFSQFWPCAFTLGGIQYKWVEQWMMASKARLFGDSEALARILAASAPLECKRIGREVRGFDDAQWRQHRFELVTVGNAAKFSQDPALRAYLIGTADELLVEAAPTDKIWGIGLGRENPSARDPNKWRGQNLLGFALIRARHILRGELPMPQLPALFQSS